MTKSPTANELIFFLSLFKYHLQTVALLHQKYIWSYEEWTVGSDGTMQQ